MALAVIGAGVTGLSFASAYGNVPVFEANGSLGGKALSYKVDTEVGTFGFDVGGHWFHHQSAPGALKLLDGLPLNSHRRYAFVYLEGRLYDYPIQQSYKQNPSSSFVGRVDEELREIGGKELQYSNYAEMLINSYGPALYDAFFRDYNRKMFGKEELASIAAGKYETVRNVRLTGNTDGYNPAFLYPKGDIGAQAIPLHLSKRVNVSFDTGVHAISLSRKTMQLKQKNHAWETIVSTIPLPLLIRLISDVEPEYLRLAEQLTASKGFIVNMGIKKKPFHEHKSWVYFPELRYHFYRLGFYSNIEPLLAPKGYSSIYVECSPLHFNTKSEAQLLLPKIIQELTEIGIIDEADDIVALRTFYLEQNYCMPDQKITSVLHRYLESNGIYSIGRYGSWHWSSQHEDMQQAVQLAEYLQSRNADQAFRTESSSFVPMK
ncbi:protoporphyrinogen/coproporphyrinogen oxidase [Paenibacillus paridis]|uniref:protoporphyrinogen/coproporphyrinogen oxidase n=1 Tax=Paenibacillus paridis TaxID=2583376 RepID=UPI00112193EE|nr:FAD-dependent oxidoreductase [Paenibacillus paridis]